MRKIKGKDQSYDEMTKVLIILAGVAMAANKYLGFKGEMFQKYTDFRNFVMEFIINQ